MNAHFITKPADILLTPVPNNDNDWIVRIPIGYYTPILDKVIIVDKCFITDLASIPRPFWWLYPKSGRYDKAVIIHDWLFWNQIGTFDQANRILEEAMICCGCSKWDAGVFYRAVSVGSKGTWNKYGKMTDKQRLTGYARITTDGFIVIPDEIK